MRFQKHYLVHGGIGTGSGEVALEYTRDHKLGVTCNTEERER